MEILVAFIKATSRGEFPVYRAGAFRNQMGADSQSTPISLAS